MNKPDNLVALHKQETGSYHCVHNRGIDGWAMDKIVELEARVATLEDFAAVARLEALRVLGPDYVPKGVELAMKSLLARCRTITCEDDPDDIEPGAFIMRKQAEAVNKFGNLFYLGA